MKDIQVGPKISTAVPPSRYQQNPMALSNGHLATVAAHYHHHTQPAMWHTRSFDSGMGEWSFVFEWILLTLSPRKRNVFIDKIIICRQVSTMNNVLLDGFASWKSVVILNALQYVINTGDQWPLWRTFRDHNDSFDDFYFFFVSLYFNVQIANSIWIFMYTYF